MTRHQKIVNCALAQMDQAAARARNDAWNVGLLQRKIERYPAYARTATPAEIADAYCRVDAEEAEANPS